MIGFAFPWNLVRLGQMNAFSKFYINQAINSEKLKELSMTKIITAKKLDLVASKKVHCLQSQTLWASRCIALIHELKFAWVKQTQQTNEKTENKQKISSICVFQLSNLKV